MKNNLRALNKNVVLFLKNSQNIRDIYEDANKKQIIESDPQENQPKQNSLPEDANPT